MATDPKDEARAQIQRIWEDIRAIVHRTGKALIDDYRERSRRRTKSAFPDSRKARRDRYRG